MYLVYVCVCSGVRSLLGSFMLLLCPMEQLGERGHSQLLQNSADLVSSHTDVGSCVIHSLRSPADLAAPGSVRTDVGVDGMNRRGEQLCLLLYTHFFFLLSIS